MRNGSDDDHLRTTFGPRPFGDVPAIGVSDSSDDAFALGEFVAALRRPADLGPGVDTAVMDAIRLAPAPLVVVSGTGRRLTARTQPDAAPVTAAPAPLPRAWRWFTRPRSVRVTPLGALAAAGIAIAAVFGLRRESNRRAGEDGTPPGAPSATGEFAVRPDGPTSAGAATTAPAAPRARDTVVITRFMLIAPGAKQVTLVGDFNDWDHGATPLARVASQGSAHGLWTIEVPLTAGRHSYAFLIDGQRWVADPRQPRAIGDDFGRPSSAITVGGEA